MSAVDSRRRSTELCLIEVKWMIRLSSALIGTVKWHCLTHKWLAPIYISIIGTTICARHLDVCKCVFVCDGDGNNQQKKLSTEALIATVGQLRLGEGGNVFSHGHNWKKKEKKIALKWHDRRKSCWIIMIFPLKTKWCVEMFNGATIFFHLLGFCVRVAHILPQRLSTVHALWYFW